MAEEAENQQGRTKRFMKNKLTRAAAIGTAAIATGFGTFSSNEGGFAPFYVNKTGNSGGIALGFYVKVEEDAEFNGLILSPVVTIDGTLNGANVNLFNLGAGGSGRVNGLEMGLADLPAVDANNEYKTERKVNGIDIGVYNNAREVGGFRIGIVNYAEEGRYGDLGVVNINDDEETGRRTVGVGLYASLPGHNDQSNPEPQSEE